MQYRFRTLLIALGWGPPTLAVLWLWPSPVVEAVLVVTLFGLLIVPSGQVYDVPNCSSSAVQKEIAQRRSRPCSASRFANWCC